MPQELRTETDKPGSDREGKDACKKLSGGSKTPSSDTFGCSWDPEKVLQLEPSGPFHLTGNFLLQWMLSGCGDPQHKKHLRNLLILRLLFMGNCEPKGEDDMEE